MKWIFRFYVVPLVDVKHFERGTHLKSNHRPSSDDTDHWWRWGGSKYLHLFLFVVFNDQSKSYKYESKTDAGEVVDKIKDTNLATNVRGKLVSPPCAPMSTMLQADSSGRSSWETCLRIRGFWIRDVRGTKLILAASSPLCGRINIHIHRFT